MSGAPLTKRHEVWIIPEIWGGPGAASAFSSVVDAFATKLGLDKRNIDLGSLDHFYNLKPAPIPPKTPAGLSARTLQVVTLQHAVKVASEQYFQDHGLPTAILHTFADRFKHGDAAFSFKGSILTPQSVFLSDKLTTTAWDSYLPVHLRSLAPHSRTVDDLRAEAARLHPLLKPDGKPLIAIVIASAEAIDGVRDSLNNLPHQYPDARFVLSSSPRMSAKKFSEFCQDFSVLLSAGQKADMIAYNYNSGEPAKNPYAGLLSIADHMIVVGDSASMISERLSAGKSVHYAPSDGLRPLPDGPASLIETGKIRYFPPGGRLATSQFRPVNVTAIIADTLIDQYRQHLETTPVTPAYSMTGMLRQGIRNAFRGLTRT